jgi:hypothetical protein
MKLYCQCGYPLMVVATWNGHDYPLSLRDSSLGKDSDPITSCPACGRAIDLADLDMLPRPHVDELEQRRARERRPRGDRHTAPPDESAASK